MDRYRVCCLYVDGSEADYREFRRHLLEQPELRLVYDISVIHKKSMNAALNWLAGMSPGDRQSIDMIFIDPLSLGQNVKRNLNKAVDYLHQFGFARSQVVVIPDADSVKDLWPTCVAQFGERHCFRKEELLEEDSFDRVIEIIEGHMSQKTSSSGNTLQHEVLRLSARVEVLMADINALKGSGSTQVQLLERQVSELEDGLAIIRNTLFQGPNTQSPALVQQMLTLRQRTASLDKEMTRVSSKIESLADKISNSNTQMKLLQASHLYRVLSIILVLLIALMLDAVFGLDLIELLINAVTG